MPEQSQSASMPVAIIGIATIAPKGPDTERHWENCLHAVNAITEIPLPRWDWRLYYTPSRRERDGIYSKWGGFIDEMPFDPMRFGLTPASLKSIEAVHLLALENVRRLLEEAGYPEGKGLPLEDTATILGVSGGYNPLTEMFSFRTQLPRVLPGALETVSDLLPRWTSDAFTGVLPNVIAGRIASHFDFGGVNFIVDAACASSLAALDLAVREIASGRCRAAVAGGCDLLTSPFMYALFGRTQALSEVGIVRAFDKKADGIVVGEASAMMLLKPLKDAERDGDKIYAVIRGIGGSSDGHGTSLTAPRVEGQRRALDRAYADAGFSSASVGLFEAHGTGTLRGDQAEVKSVSSILRDHGAAPASCALTAVKALVGHTKGAAGALGVAKAALALYHKVLPAHVNVDEPLDELTRPDEPLFMVKQSIPWLQPSGEPRRAGVSAFGFGGTNFHLVLEEYMKTSAAAPRGAMNWPCELFIWTGPDTATVKADLQRVRARLVATPTPRLRDIAFTLAKQAAPAWQVAVTLVAGTLDELGTTIDAVIARLDSGTGNLPANAFLRVLEKGTQARAGKLAFVFPGQGSQYPGMGREVALFCGAMADAMETADKTLAKSYDRPLSRFVMPPAAYSTADDKQRQDALANTHVAQPALGAVESGYLDTLAALGVKPEMTAGHSYGEYVALHAAGAIRRDQLLSLSELRGRLMSQKNDGPAGTMAAVKSRRETVMEIIAGIDGLVIANHNAPTQTVISGPVAAVEAALKICQERNIAARALPVSGAFHSRLMEQAQKPLAEAILAADLAKPAIPVYSNLTGKPYATDANTMRRQLAQHMLSQVEFVAMIEAMYTDGARIFLEAGPGQVLCGLVHQILAERPHVAVAADPMRGALRGLLMALAELLTQGIFVQLEELYHNRNCRMMEWQQVPASEKPRARTWWLTGNGVRTNEEPYAMPGTVPLHTFETAAAAIAASKENISMSDSAKPSGNAPADGEALRAFEAYQQTMRDFLRLQEQIMRQFVSGADGAATAATAAPAPAPATPVAAPVLRPAAPTPAPVAPPPTPVAVAAAPAAVSVGLDRESLTKLVLNVFSERTGYPTDMLGLDQNMEADLGIDSIKRIEILGVVISTLPPAMSEKLKTEMSTMAQVRTLNDVITLALKSV